MSSGLISTLKQLVSKDTRYTKKREGNLAGLLQKLLTKHGFQVQTVVTDGRANILADNKKPGPALLFYGHLDTVDLTPGWTKKPFLLTVQGNKAFGLGAYDMKGGIAAFLSASIGATRHIKMMFAVDEENISAGAWDVVQRRQAFFKDVELIISAEPNFGLGLHGITIGRTGRVIFTAHSQGNPVHIAHHTEGLNAIFPLTNFIGRLQKTNIGQDPLTVVQPRALRSTVIGMSLCESAEGDIEVLLGEKDSIEAIQQQLQTLADAVPEGVITVELAPRSTPYLTGYRFDHFPYQEIIATLIQQHTNQAMKLHERSSVGDDNVLATLGIPVITWGPDGGGAHEADEWVDIKSLETLTTLYRGLIVATS